MQLYIFQLVNPPEIFPYHDDYSREIHDTSKSSDDTYDTERPKYLALSSLYSFDPYDVQDDRKDDINECISKQNIDNYPF